MTMPLLCNYSEQRKGWGTCGGMRRHIDEGATALRYGAMSWQGGERTRAQSQHSRCSGLSIRCRRELFLTEDF